MLYLPKGWPKGMYRGWEDPYFLVLKYVLLGEDAELAKLIVWLDLPREISAIPTVIIHPNIDIAVVERTSKNYLLQNEFGRCARAALTLVDTIEEPATFFRKKHKQFKNNFNKTRRKSIEELARNEGPSIIDKYDMRSFKHLYEVYRYSALYHGKIYQFGETEFFNINNLVVRYIEENKEDAYSLAHQVFVNNTDTTATLVKKRFLERISAYQGTSCERRNFNRRFRHFCRKHNIIPPTLTPSPDHPHL